MVFQQNIEGVCMSDTFRIHKAKSDIRKQFTATRLPMDKSEPSSTVIDYVRWFLELFRPPLTRAKATLSLRSQTAGLLDGVPYMNSCPPP